MAGMPAFLNASSRMLCYFFVPSGAKCFLLLLLCVLGFRRAWFLACPVFKRGWFLACPVFKRGGFWRGLVSLTKEREFFWFLTRERGFLLFLSQRARWFLLFLVVSLTEEHGERRVVLPQKSASSFVSLTEERELFCFSQRARVLLVSLSQRSASSFCFTAERKLLFSLTKECVFFWFLSRRSASSFWFLSQRSMGSFVSLKGARVLYVSLTRARALASALLVSLTIQVVARDSHSWMNLLTQQTRLPQKVTCLTHRRQNFISINV